MDEAREVIEKIVAKLIGWLPWFQGNAQPHIVIAILRWVAVQSAKAAIAVGDNIYLPQDLRPQASVHKQWKAAVKMLLTTFDSRTELQIQLLEGVANAIAEGNIGRAHTVLVSSLGLTEEEALEAIRALTPPSGE